MRILVAAFGNELRGDDGFGIAVLKKLEAMPPAPHLDVRLLHVGTAGIRLAQELLSPCDRLIVVDAIRRGGAPGTLYVLEVEDIGLPAEVDMHLAVPGQALGLARALGAVPREAFMVGCEPLDVDELTTEMSAPVREAVDLAVRHVASLYERKP